MTWRWKKGRVGEQEARAIAADGRELKARVGQIDYERWAWRLDVQNEEAFSGSVEADPGVWRLIASGISSSRTCAQAAAQKAATSLLREPSTIRSRGLPAPWDFRAGRR